MEIYYLSQELYAIIWPYHGFHRAILISPGKSALNKQILFLYEIRFQWTKLSKLYQNDNLTDKNECLT